MLQRTDGLRVNPADETIGIKGFTVRFLLTGSEFEWQRCGLRACRSGFTAAAGPGAQP